MPIWAVRSKASAVSIEIHTEPDHLHGLFLLARTAALSDVVGHLKKSSNDWLRGRGPQFASFFWQAGFGAFSVSQSQVEDVRAYIRNQREHHRVKTLAAFQAAGRWHV